MGKSAKKLNQLLPNLQPYSRVSLFSSTRPVYSITPSPILEAFFLSAALILIRNQPVSGFVISYRLRGPGESEARHIELRPVQNYREIVREVGKQFFVRNEELRAWARGQNNREVGDWDEPCRR